MEVIEHHHREIGMGRLAVLHQGADLLDGGGKAGLVMQAPHGGAIGALLLGQAGQPGFEAAQVVSGDHPAPALQVVAAVERRWQAMGPAAVVGHQSGGDGAAREFAGEEEHRGPVEGQAHGGGDSNGGFADAGAGGEHPGAFALAGDHAAAHVQIERGDAGGDRLGALIQRHRGQGDAFTDALGHREHAVAIAEVAGGEGGGLIHRRPAGLDLGLDRSIELPALQQLVEGPIEHLPGLG